MPQAVLFRSSYKPARGGHAPGDVREAFLRGIEAFADWRPGAPEPHVEVREQSLALSVLCGLLWNCTDTLPRLDAEMLSDALPWRPGPARPCGSYAQAARTMRRAITRQAALARAV